MVQGQVWQSLDSLTGGRPEPPTTAPPCQVLVAITDTQRKEARKASASDQALEPHDAKCSSLICTQSKELRLAAQLQFSDLSAWLTIVGARSIHPDSLARRSEMGQPVSSSSAVFHILALVHHKLSLP